MSQSDLRKGMDALTPKAPEIPMVSIQAGTLPSGASVGKFELAETPTTIQQWNAVCDLPQVQIPLQKEAADGENLEKPKVNITWYETVEFCARLSAHTGRNYRLPAEAEWEYACRAGTTSDFNNGTNSLSVEEANFGGHYDGTTDVRKFAPNPWGLYDMHGNVWEWCADNYKEEEGGGMTSARLLRGGSWLYVPVYCRSAFRGRLAPDDGYVNVGFRVACDVDESGVKKSGASSSIRLMRGGSWYSDPWFCRSALRNWLHRASLSGDVGFRVA